MIFCPGKSIHLILKVCAIFRLKRIWNVQTLKRHSSFRMFATYGYVKKNKTKHPANPENSENSEFSEFHF